MNNIYELKESGIYNAGYDDFMRSSDFERLRSKIGLPMKI